jgi:hypothetical protein
MKKVILVFCLMPYLASGQVVENFEQADCSHWSQSTAGRWKSDTTQCISGQYSLHHVYDNADAGTDQAGIRTDSLHPDEGTVKWSFLIRHGYDPSSSNNWAAFLMSDSDPSVIFSDGNVKGFAVGVNITGYDDTLRLCKIDGSMVTPVVDTRINWQSAIGTSDPVSVTVERTSGGTWSVSVSDLQGGLIGTASASDNELFQCNWFILSYKYTSSRDKLLWFDDLHIDGVFHENSEIPDTTYVPATGDVIISEIMADPDPPVSLPSEEYIEITNRKGVEFKLDGWKLTTGTQDYPIPETVIKPYGIITLCQAADTSGFSRFGKTVGLKQFPSLTDNGRLLLLYDNSGSLIHGLEYSSEWYNDELKSDGGWSLEMIDTDYPFYYKGNWRASLSKTGGTPGNVNSVAANNPDDRFAGDLNLFPTDSLHISVFSPEPLFTLMGMIDSIRIDDYSPVRISSADPLKRDFSLQLEHPLKKGKVYKAVISGRIVDFAGNRLAKESFEFGLTDPAESGDVRFNELLFNPFPGDPDYIEFYNSSDMIIDASRLGLVSIYTDSDDTSKVYPVSERPGCILPGTYYAISTETEKVISRYFSADPDHLYVAGSLPSLPDEKGHLVLFSRELEKIDEVTYTEKMHSSLLAGYEGVALEKIKTDGDSQDAVNWHSATESSGWGTPGAPNSVLLEQPSSGSDVSLSSTRISPDDDGYQDVLEISFSLTGNNNIISVTVFDEYGNLIRNLASNVYAGQKASVIWDGKSDDGTLVQTGIYIVLINMYNESGKTRKWKKVCTVIRR